MKRFTALLKLYIENMYGISSLFSDFLSGGVKSKLKGFGIALLCLYVIFALGMSMFIMTDALISVLYPAGLFSAAILQICFLATMITFLFGFISVLSTLFLQEAEKIILSMPFTNKELFAAKFILSYILECSFSIIIFGSVLVSLGIHGFLNPILFISIFLTAFLLPVVPLALSFMLIIPLLRVFSFLQNKDMLLGFMGFLGITLGLVFNIYYQGAVINMQNAEYVIQNFGNATSLMNVIAIYYPFTFFASNAIIAPNIFISFLWTALFFISSSAIVFALVFFFSNGYVSIISSFSEVKLVKKHSALNGKMVFKQKNILLTLFKREFVLMNREPSFFLNGPFVIILMPLIMLVMFFVQKDKLQDLLILLKDIPSASHIVLWISAGMGIFLSVMTNIAATAVSREGASFYYIKSLPLSSKNYFLGKLLHAFFFIAFGTIVGVIPVSLIGGLSFFEICTAFGISFFWSSAMNILMLMLDAAFPKLSWTNPISALKQNPNSVIGTLSSMVFIALMGFLVYKTLSVIPYLHIYVLLLGLVLSVISYLVFMKWAEKRYAFM